MVDYILLPDFYLGCYLLQISHPCPDKLSFLRICILILSLWGGTAQDLL